MSYEFNHPDLRAAEADNVAKTQHFNGATKAAADAAASTAAADAAAGADKTAAAAAFAVTNYHDPGFPAAEAANAAAVKNKEATLDAALKAHDTHVEKTL